MPLVLALLGALRAALGARSDLVPENLALRQQLALLRRRAKRPRFGQLDRLFWMWLSQRVRTSFATSQSTGGRQLVQGDGAAPKRYLVIAAGTPASIGALAQVQQ